jgi:AmmeMemoRadiSam system protein B
MNIAHVQTSRAAWTTLYGTLRPNTELIDTLIHDGTATAEEETFTIEHSVCGLVTMVKRYFPNATLIPIVLKSNTTKDESQKLSDNLTRICPTCLMIASVDFAHNTTTKDASMRDALSVDILTSLKEKMMNEVIADSPATLSTLVSYEKQTSASPGGQLIHESDSYRIGSTHPESVTSYVTVLYN